MYDQPKKIWQCICDNIKIIVGHIVNRRTFTDPLFMKMFSWKVLLFYSIIEIKNDVIGLFYDTRQILSPSFAFGTGYSDKVLTVYFIIDIIEAMLILIKPSILSIIICSINELII